MFPDDVDFAFVAGDALADTNDVSAKFGNPIGETTEALVDGLETLFVERYLRVETLVDDPVLRVEAIALDCDKTDESSVDGGEGDHGVTVLFGAGWRGDCRAPRDGTTDCR